MMDEVRPEGTEWLTPRLSLSTSVSTVSFSRSLRVTLSSPPFHYAPRDTRRETEGTRRVTSGWNGEGKTERRFATLSLT